MSIQLQSFLFCRVICFALPVHYKDDLFRGSHGSHSYFILIITIVIIIIYYHLDYRLLARPYYFKLFYAHFAFTYLYTFIYSCILHINGISQPISASSSPFSMFIYYFLCRILHILMVVLKSSIL